MERMGEFFVANRKQETDHPQRTAPMNLKLAEFH